jgi:hypothetical protein
LELTVTYTVLSLDPDGYVQAATKAQRAIAYAESSGRDALSSMVALAHMGGNDEAGGKFAHAYDKQAAAIFDGLGDLCTALSQTAAALGASAVSHANAELANTTGSTGPSPVVPDPTPAVIVDFAHPVSAYGGTNILPQGWVFIQELVSATWPDGDSGKMRHGKAVWDALADDIDSVRVRYLSTMLDSLQGFQAPDIAAITSKTSLLVTGAKQLADACRALGTACSEYAAAIDKAHQDAGAELAEFVITTAAAIGISLILTPITAGVSDLVGGAAVAADAAVTAGEVSSTLGVLVARVAPLLVKLGELSRDTASLSSFGAKATLFFGKSAAVGSVWSVASVYGDYAVNGSAATPIDDIKYSVIAGGVGSIAVVGGEALSNVAKDAMTGSARAGVRIAAEGVPKAGGEVAADEAPLSGHRHSAGPTPVKVTVTTAGIKATTFAAGTAAGSVAGQAVTTGVSTKGLPEDLAKDGIQGKIPILEPGGLHVAK